MKSLQNKIGLCKSVLYPGILFVYLCDVDLMYRKCCVFHGNYMINILIVISYILDQIFTKHFQKKFLFKSEFVLKANRLFSLSCFTSYLYIEEASTQSKHSQRYHISHAVFHKKNRFYNGHISWS